MDICELLKQEFDQYITDSIDIQNQILDLLTSNIDIECTDLFDLLKTEKNLELFNILVSLNYTYWWYPSQFALLERIIDLIYPIIIENEAVSKEQLKYEIFTSKLLKKKILSLLSPLSNNVINISSQKSEKRKKYGISNKEIFKIIQNDDFVTFQDIVSQFDIDLDGMISIPSNFEHKTFFRFDYHENFPKDNKDNEKEEEEDFDDDKKQNCINHFAFKGKFIEIAAFFGSINIFKFLWMNKVNIDNCINKYVIAGGNYEIIHLAEECISYSPEDLDTAIRFHHNDIYDYIINNNDFKFNKNEIKTAVRSNNLEFLVSSIESIKESDFFVNKNEETIHLLMKSIQNKNAMIFIYIFIQSYQYLKEYKNFSLSSILKEAISEKSFEIVKFLVNVQSKIGDENRFIDDVEGIDLIKGTGEIIEYLIPQMSHKIEFDSNLMCKASANSVVEVVKLIDDKCNLFKDAKFNDNETPFHCACLAGNLDVINYLAKKHKEWIESKDNDGLLPIHNAVISSKLRIVKYLINDLKVDINVVDNEDRTPLHYAVDEKFIDIVEFLCSLKDININIKNINGATPLELAINKKNLNIVNILKKKGGKQNIFSNI